MPKTASPKVSAKTHIIINKAFTHNLKGVTVALPRGKFIVITGLSGSGKSSLAFDTLYAEGQRRYVESMSSYARQFMGKMDKPPVESITGISPAVAIEQKVSTRTGRSTVGTSTEIYDYLRLLFARIGKTYSPVSGEEVKRDTVGDVSEFIASLPVNTRCLITSPVNAVRDRTLAEQLEVLKQQGYARVRLNGKTLRIDDANPEAIPAGAALEVVTDRVVNKPDDEENAARIADSAETAFFEGRGTCRITVLTDGGEETRTFTNRFERDGIEFEIPSDHFFSFNNPLGACPVCEGFGSVIGIDPDAVIPDKKLSIYEDAVAAWRGETMGEWKRALISVADKFDFPIHRPYRDLTAEQKELLWTGNKHFRGLDAFFKHLEAKSYKIQYRVMLSRYRGKTICPDCKGSRLRKETEYVKIDGHTLTEILRLPVSKSLVLVRELYLNETDRQIAKRLLTEIGSRLHFLNETGLGYLSLDRLSNSLSGGESQRIKLAACLGSSLVGSMYILDEPSIGLHSHDTRRLIGVLRSLQKLGNTVIVVEHDEEIMQAADEIIDIGPGAGTHGGEIVFQGNHEALLTAGNSLTADYLTGRTQIPLPEKRRKSKHFLTVKGACENNLKNIDVDFPLECLTAVTGVSGSGKSTLVRDILYPALNRKLGGFGDKPGDHDEVTGNLKAIKAVEFVDQNPIGKSSRSNPVTYVKAFDEIRALFAAQKMSKVRNYKPGHFSFNVKGGRCETCEGEGTVTIEMQFMADIVLTCDDCKGKRYKKDTLEVKYRGKHIADILSMTVSEAVAFFREDEKNKTAVKIAEKLTPLEKTGLGYVQLGQASSTLSGGEAQRTKLAAFLAKGEREPNTLFIFDEPTTGLHFHDVAKLLQSFRELIYRGHSVMVIEHNLDVIKCADWVIDLGPEGGDKGGDLVFTGTPEALISCEASLTGKYLSEKFR